jgi:hypothetical protein
MEPPADQNGQFLLALGDINIEPLAPARDLGD